MLGETITVRPRRKLCNLIIYITSYQIERDTILELFRPTPSLSAPSCYWTCLVLLWNSRFTVAENFLVILLLCHRATVQSSCSWEIRVYLLMWTLDSTRNFHCNLWTLKSTQIIFDIERARTSDACDKTRLKIILTHTHSIRRFTPRVWAFVWSSSRVSLCMNDTPSVYCHSNANLPLSTS